MERLANAIRDLMLEYKKATAYEFVRDPVAYALYQTWKKYDKDNAERWVDEHG